MGKGKMDKHSKRSRHVTVTVVLYYITRDMAGKGGVGFPMVLAIFLITAHQNLSEVYSGFSQTYDLSHRDSYLI